MLAGAGMPRSAAACCRQAKPACWRIEEESNTGEPPVPLLVRPWLLASHGQAVKIGDQVGQPPIKDGKPALGAPVHASINGTVTAVENGIVWIEKK